MINQEWQPYIYQITNTRTKHKYIGCQYKEGCNPKDLWVTYFTSSLVVRKAVERFGKDAFKVKILKVFSIPDILLHYKLNSVIMCLTKDTKSLVRSYVLKHESELLQKRKAKSRREYYNLSDGTEFRHRTKATKRGKHG